MIHVEKHHLKVTVLLLVHDMMGGKALIVKKKKTEVGFVESVHELLYSLTNLFLVLILIRFSVLLAALISELATDNVLFCEFCGWMV